MPVKRKHAFIRRVKDISIAGSISLSILTGGVGLQSCESQPQEYETVYTKGIHTHISEIEPGNFKIVDEQNSEDGSTAAYVSYLDGHTEKLEAEQIKTLIAEKSLLPEADTTGLKSTDADSLGWKSGHTDTKKIDSTSSVSNHHRSHFGGLGTILLYSSLGSMFGRSAAPNPQFYANQSTYQKAQETTAQYKNSAVRRPVSSSKGFFNSSRGYGSGRGFGS